MDEPVITSMRRPYDDSAWRVVIRASDGEFAGGLEFYTAPQELSEFGRRLAAFPIGPGDEARLELGARDGDWAYYLLLRAFLVDLAGHAALEFAADNREASPNRAEASFFNSCEVAAINRLGRQLQSWLDRSDKPLSWAIPTG